MPGNFPFDFSTTELNSTLMLTPFGDQTNWHVITGASSSGKTTVIRLLADQGFQTVPEAGRLYMESEIARGRTLDEIHDSGPALQIAIADVKLRIESELRLNDVAFLDDALPGSLAWYRLFGLNPNELLPDCFRHRYASVFVLDRLPLDLNGFRFSGDSYLDYLDEWIYRDYSALGYSVVRVPVLAPDERTAFILENLTEQGLI